MDRNELTLAIAGALVGAVLLGWMLRWIFDLMNRRAGPRSLKRSAELAEQLHAAEDARARAEARMQRVEADLGQRIVELQNELDAALRSLDQAQAQADEIRAAYCEATGARAAPQV